MPPRLPLQYLDLDCEPVGQHGNVESLTSTPIVSQSLEKSEKAKGTSNWASLVAPFLVM
jgi:hypothetical protein